MATAQRKPVSVVVALDFGTTYSGYAFSSVKDYKTSKLDITMNQAWNSGKNQLTSFKTPTSLLLKRNGDFVSYGYEAEKAYENKLLDKTADKHEFLYFRQFKMELYVRKAHSNMKLKDIHGIEHAAIDVFTQSIGALRQSCLSTLKNQGYELEDDEIKWYLTVPAIWTDEAKIFMRTSCEKAGIPSYRLVIALEPEVASLYCQIWFAESEKKSAFRPHTKCLVVDLGGGTADISGHEILKKGLFKEICKSTGMACEESGNTLLVAAIDFGTTYSGYAFSTRDSFKKDKLDIKANQVWNAGSKQLLSLKTPTCLLLKKNQEIVSFGYQAENDYAAVVTDETEDDYYFFQQFKMKLYRCENLTLDIPLLDVRGQSLPAVVVFASCIKALRDHLHKTLSDKGVPVNPDEIKWVLTVPAIWSDGAKQFMRESAKRAGIKDDKLVISLEPEDASIYCQCLSMASQQGFQEGFSKIQMGTKYMVVDLGEHQNKQNINRTFILAEV